MKNHEQQPQYYEGLPQQVGQNIRDCDLDFFDVVHDRGHQPAGGVRFEELRALPDHLIEYGVAQVGDRGAAYVIHQVIGQVVADSLGEEDCQ